MVYVVNEEIKTLNQLGVPNSLAFEFLKLGTEDLEKVDVICAKHNMRAPTEMKLYYDVETGKSAGEIFLEWITEIKGETCENY